jgi:hypothetical protein
MLGELDGGVSDTARSRDALGGLGVDG